MALYRLLFKGQINAAWVVVHQNSDTQVVL
jgi:hypothetical protein